MNAKLYGALFGLALGLVTPAKADYVVKDGNGVLQTIKSGTLSGGILPWSNLVDATGIALGTAANPLAMTFGTGVLLPQFASPAHFICDSGCAGSGGTSSNFGSAFPSAGTALGVSNGTNMIALTLGQALAAASVPVILPAATITTLTPPTSVGITGTLPGFAATPTFNCGTGCSSTGGTFNNNADGVATSTTNGQSAAWL